MHHRNFFPPGRSAVVARLVWDQEVGSSNLPAPTRYKLAVASEEPKVTHNGGLTAT